MTKRNRFEHIEPRLPTPTGTTSDTGEILQRIAVTNPIEPNPDTATTQPEMECPPEEPTLMKALAAMVGQDTEPPNLEYSPYQTDQKNPFWERMRDFNNFTKIRAVFEAVIKGEKPIDRQATVDLLWLLKLLAQSGPINWHPSPNETLLGFRSWLPIAAQTIFKDYESIVDELIHKMRISAGARE